MHYHCGSRTVIQEQKKRTRRDHSGEGGSWEVKWRRVFWLCGSTELSSVCLVLQASCDPMYCAFLMNWSLRLMSVHSCRLCCVCPGRRGFQSWFRLWAFFTSLRPKLAEMKAPPTPPPPPPPPVIGRRILSSNSAASHFCNLQINIYGSTCSAGRSGSRPSGKIEERAFGGLQLSLCAALSLAGRTTQMCFVLS